MPDEDPAIAAARKRNEDDLLAEARAKRDRLRLSELERMLQEAADAEERLHAVERANGGKLM